MKLLLCGRIPRRRYAFHRGFGSRKLPAPKVTAVAIGVVRGCAALCFAVCACTENSRITGVVSSIPIEPNTINASRAILWAGITESRCCQRWSIQDGGYAVTVVTNQCNLELWGRFICAPEHRAIST